MIVLAHISDLHIDGNLRNAERTDRVMRYLNEQTGLDAVLVTGDIADTGSQAQYEQARYLLESDHQVIAGPGSHDERNNMREFLLRERGGDAPLNQVIKAGGAVIAMLDSTVPGQTEGFLATETLVWLEDLLASQAPELPVFVGLHHPMTALSNAAALAEIVERYPSVVAILAGHDHSGSATTFAGRPLLTAPGVANTAPLPWDGWDYDYAGDPAVAFHTLDDNGNLTTHFRVVGE